MENPWSTSKMKVLKARTSNENVPPLQIDMDDKRGRYLQPTAISPRFQPYAENIDVSSPLARYFFGGSPLSGKVTAACEVFTPPTFGASKYRTAKAPQYCGNSSGSSSFGSRGRLSPSPLSSIENLEIASLMSPPMYRTPPTGDDDVIVMDDILVRPMSGGKSGRSSSSSGRVSSSSASTAKSVLKTEICRAWEESGNCRYNSKCQVNFNLQPHRDLCVGCVIGMARPTYVDMCYKAMNMVKFAHGKEELHTGRPSMKSKSGGQTSKSSNRPISSTHGSTSHAVHQQYAAAESEHEVTTSQPTSPEPHHTLTNSNTVNDWSPLDDGIEVVLPNGSDKALSRNEVNAYISSIPCGRTAKRRLPVFAALC